MDTLERVLNRTIYLTVTGSHLYGTALPTSDYDFKGIAIPSEKYFLGFLHSFEQLERQVSKGAPNDLTIIALAKFAKLAVDCNPNVIELLFATDDDIVHIDKFGHELRWMRNAFVSKKARHTFSGYAHAQLKRIKTHRKWLLDPPSHKPTRAEFGLGETTKVSKSELGAFEAVEDTVELPKDVLSLFLKERQYQAAMTTWNQYENWKATRNEARSQLEAKYGYDTKHGMHLMRLMRMCREILRDGEVVVKRPDAKELLAIRAGEWSYDRLIDEADQLDKECEELYVTSSIPKEPNRVYIDACIVDLTASYLNER